MATVAAFLLCDGGFGEKSRVVIVQDDKAEGFDAAYLKRVF